MSIIIAGCDVININYETNIILNFPTDAKSKLDNLNGVPTFPNQRSNSRKLIPRIHNDWQCCSHCSYKSKFRGNLIKHIGLWHDPGRKRKGKFETHPYHECAHCRYGSKSKQLLQNHMIARHCEPVNRECPQCHVILKNHLCLNSHLQYCGKGLDYSCKRCPFKTRYKNHLKRHMDTVHAATDSSVECPNKCGSILKNKASLRGHLHFCGTELFSVQCRYCSFRPKRKSLLELHMSRVHSDENNIMNQCPKCTKKFKKKAYLVKHTPYCDSKPIFQCATCGHTFNKKHLLENHIVQKHLNSDCDEMLEPYSHCPRCRIGFKHQSDLSEHLVRCGHEVAFQCYHCPFKTKMKDHLKNHILCAHIESNELYQINMRNYINTQSSVDLPFRR